MLGCIRPPARGASNEVTVTASSEVCASGIRICRLVKREETQQAQDGVNAEVAAVVPTPWSGQGDPPVCRRPDEPVPESVVVVAAVSSAGIRAEQADGVGNDLGRNPSRRRSSVPDRTIRSSDLVGDHVCGRCADEGVRPRG